jgi:hypothetical protein
MGPPSLVVAAAANRRNTRAALTEDTQSQTDEPHFPRRFPRTGNAFQCKIGAFRRDESGSLESQLSTYESSRPVPQPMSVDYPHATMDVVAQSALESTSNVNSETMQCEKDVDKQGESWRSMDSCTRKKRRVRRWKKSDLVQRIPHSNCCVRPKLYGLFSMPCLYPLASYLSSLHSMLSYGCWQ